MALSRPRSDATTRNVVHVVVGDPSSAMCAAVVHLVGLSSRDLWYPTLFLETEAEGSQGDRLAFEARTLGVPVTSPRRPRGKPGGDRIRLFVDEWFFVRDAHPSILHIHARVPISWSQPVDWVRRVTRSAPAVVSVYHLGSDESDSSTPISVTINTDTDTDPTRVAIDSIDLDYIDALYTRAIGTRDRRWFGVGSEPTAETTHTADGSRSRQEGTS